uniref:Uncharacterized protein n=1 Tax=Anguilla anguilla TaxID=7936 RepID=A0A0E9UY10_ANGAN
MAARPPPALRVVARCSSSTSSSPSSSVCPSCVIWGRMFTLLRKSARDCFSPRTVRAVPFLFPLC